MKVVARFITLLSLLICSASFAATLHMATDADPSSLDPHEQLSQGTLQLSHLAFDPLLRWRQDHTFEPRLATSWKSIDKLTTRFELRKDVYFHSGNEFDADDVIYTVKRLKSSVEFRALFDNIKHIEKRNDYSIDIITHKPTPLLLNLMAYLFPMDKDFYQGRDDIVKFGNSFASRNLSGTGPFIITSREPGTRIEFVRNANYWDTNSKGNVDRIEFSTIKSDATRLAALLSGDVDFIFPISPLDMPRVKRSRNIQLVTLPSTRILFLQLNQNRRAELKNTKVRQAINLAVNQEIIVDKILKGFGTAAAQLSADDFLGYLDSIKPRFELDKARQLMREAGYEEGFRVSMMAPNNRYIHDEKIAQAITAMLAKIKIKVDLKTLPKAQYFQEFDKRSADIMMLGWQSDTLDSNNIFEFIIACPNAKTGYGVYNANGYCNPNLDNRIKSANRELNPEKRIRLLQQIESTIAQDAVIVPIAWEHLAWGAKQNVNIKDVINSQDWPYLGDLVID